VPARKMAGTPFLFAEGHLSGPGGTGHRNEPLRQGRPFLRQGRAFLRQGRAFLRQGKPFLRQGRPEWGIHYSWKRGQRAERIIRSEREKRS